MWPVHHLLLPIREEDVIAALQDGPDAAILQCCMGQAHSAKAISEATGLPPVSVYRHIHRLVERHLLVIERSAVTATGKPYDLYRCPLEWAGLLVSAEGLRTKWRRHQDMGDRLHGLWKHLESRK